MCDLIIMHYVNLLCKDTNTDVNKRCSDRMGLEVILKILQLHFCHVKHLTHLF